MKKTKIKLDFIGIGAQRSGTTWLYEMLKQHPQINFGRKKEIEFFNDKASSYVKKIDKNYQKGLKWYKKQLDPKEDKISGEISNNYMFDPVCAERIHKDFPDVKIIAVLRDPVERAYSQYKFANQKIHIADSFEDALEIYDEFVERGMYYKQLKRYYDNFPKKNIFVILLDEIKDNPEGVLKGVEFFLGVRTFIPTKIREIVNPTIVAKSRKISKTLSKVQNIKSTRFGRLLWRCKITRWMIDIVGRQVISANSREGKIEMMKYYTKIMLRSRLKGDIDKLEKLIGKDLSRWKR